MTRNFYQATIDRAREIWALKPVFLDTETTGLGDKAEIIEICMVDSEGSILIDTLVRPRVSIPMDAVRLHGITDEMVHGAQTWLHIWPQVEDLLNGRYVGVYNAEFDLRMMQQTHRAVGLIWRPPRCNFFDIMKMYADFSGLFKWKKLEEAARQCGVKPLSAHRAYQDTLLARDVFLFIVNGG